MHHYRESGAHAGIFEGEGGWNFKKYFALTKVKVTLFTITFTVRHICYFNFNTNTFLFFFARFPRYRDFIDLLKYDAM